MEAKNVWDSPEISGLTGIQREKVALLRGIFEATGKVVGTGQASIAWATRDGGEAPTNSNITWGGTSGWFAGHDDVIASLHAAGVIHAGRGRGPRSGNPSTPKYNNIQAALSTFDAFMAQATAAGVKMTPEQAKSMKNASIENAGGPDALAAYEAQQAHNAAMGALDKVSAPFMVALAALVKSQGGNLTQSVAGKQYAFRAIVAQGGHVSGRWESAPIAKVNDEVKVPDNKS